MTKYEKISLIISIASLVIQLIDLLKQTMKKPNVTISISSTYTRQAISYLQFLEMSLTPATRRWLFFCQLNYSILNRNITNATKATTRNGVP